MTDLVEFIALSAIPLGLGLATFAFFRSRSVRQNRAGLASLLAGNGLVAATLLAFVLLGFETHLRFFYDASDGDNRTRVSQRWFARHWHNNNTGLRDDVDYALRRAPGKRRVSFVGDSFTAGHGVPDPGVRYVNLLRAANPDWEVHALAIPGLETPEEMQLLDRLLKRGYELDVVVLAFYVENVGRFVPELRQYFAQAARPLPFPLPFLMRHSYAVDTFAYRAQSRWMYARGYWSDVYQRAYAGDPWEAQQKAFRAFRALVESHGGRFAAITFPTLAGVEGRREMIARIDAFWAAEGVPHLELLSVLEPHPVEDLVANPHDAHPSALAHRLAAEAVQRFLDERVLGEPER